MKRLRALIADDEEALRAHLRRRLASLWPELEIAAEARDGEEAARLIKEARPDIAFLDIKMPGMSGLEAARRTAGQSLFVFVTAFDKYAIEAFDHGAIDYLLKPVTDERLEKTITRLKQRLATNSPAPDISAVIDKVTQALKQAPAHLQWIKAQHKNGVRLIPVHDIYYFKAADKYTTLRIKEGELLIRKSIKELEEELDSEMFWRVHRGAIVNIKTIRTVTRSVAGTSQVKFNDIPDHVTVSRAFGHLFKQM
jgi:DNA-binding LytR/AlgR family response regulator